MSTSTSALFSLPVDIFDTIVRETVLTVGLFEAVQLRLVCRTYKSVPHISAMHMPPRAVHLRSEITL